jgi:hypothetical protein
MRWILSLTLAALTLLPLAASAQTSCPRCTQQIELQSAQWQCLVRRLPSLQAEQTPIVFFVLTPSSCSAQTSVNVQGSVQIPTAARDGTRAPADVYRLTHEQLNCISRRAASVRPEGGVYRFDFAAECR